MTPEDRLDAAFAAVPRTLFLPPDQQRFAGLDRALPLGYGQTGSQPTTVRDMLRLLDLRSGQRVLDVGCGSGWTTALLAHLVGPDGEVLGVEVVPELVGFGRRNLAGCDYPWSSIRAAEPGVLGLPGSAPYDRVLVSAESGTVPRALVRQLLTDGVMVVPVAGRMAVVRRTDPDPDAEPEVELHGHYLFVPLVEP